MPINKESCLTIVPHRETWERLLIALEAAKSSFQHYDDLLICEERALRTMDRQSLTGINIQKEHVLDDMRRFERQIEQAFRDLAGVGNQKSIGNWLKKNRDVCSGRASAILADLLPLANRIREQSQINATLICRIHERICAAIYFMHTGSGAGPVYQETGTLNFPSPPGLVHLQG